ncbi:MAG: alpha/beta hydrolase [Novosphingobium sp.]|nr:alpha/beta hydrolase [Novosphingobium sp.]
MDTQFVAGAGGARLAVHRMGAGRPVVLLHGLFSSARVNWIKFGTAERLVAAGFEAIMPDLRAHGQSDAPHDPAAYPADVLVQDAQTVVAALGLKDYDLVGFSLGSRTAVACVLAGLRPSRAVLGGMGLEGLSGWARRSAHFISAIDRFGTIPREDPAYLAQAFMKSMNIDRVAARLLLQSVDDIPAVALAAVTMPTLVLCGSEDQDNGSAQALTEQLPNAVYRAVPGTHMSSVTKPEFGAAIAEFLEA